MSHIQMSGCYPRVTRYPCSLPGEGICVVRTPEKQGCLYLNPYPKSLNVYTYVYIYIYIILYIYIVVVFCLSWGRDMMDFTLVGLLSR